MSIKDMDGLDLKLLLLSGSSIKVNNFEIVPYSFDEIVKNVGYNKYMKNLQWISLSVDDFIKSVLDIEKRMFLESEKENLKTFDFYAKLGGQDMLENLLDALSMILRTEDIKVIEEGVIGVNFEKLGIYIYDENGNLTVDEKKLNTIDESKLMILHRDNFDEIIEVVKLQNYLMKPPSNKDVTEEQHYDEATRLLMEQMKRNEEKVQKAKKRQALDNEEEDDDIDIFDIISSVSTKSNSLNKLNIWSLTIYQLYDEYARLELIDNYDFSIKAMMAGAEKIDIKHWSSKI